MEPLPAPLRRAPWLEHVLVVALFTVLTVGLTWPTVLLLDQGIDAFGDVVLQLTTMTWDAHALLTDPFHIFNAPFFYPYYHSLAYSDHLIGQTLLTLPVFLLSGNPALALNSYKLFSFVATGYGTYLLVRDTTGSRAGGLLAGVAFAFCGLRFMQLTHLHILATEGFPFTLWALRRGLARNSGGWLAAAAGFFALLALCSVYYTYFLALAVGGYLLWWAARWWLRGRAQSRALPWRAARPVKLTVVGGGLAVVILPFFIPYLQVNSELGLARSIYEVENWSAVWPYYLRVLPSNWLWGTHGLLPASILGERELFPGGIVLALAALGLILEVWRLRAGSMRQVAAADGPDAPALWAAPQPAERWYWLGLGLIALVLTFGLSYRLPGGAEIPLPYALLYDWVPGFQALRVPVRFAMLVDLALAVLAGFAIADFRFWILDFGLRCNLAAPKPKVQNLKWLTALWLLPVGGILLESAQVLDLSNHQAVRPAQIAPYSWLAAHASGPVIEFPFYGDSGDVWYMYWGTYHWLPLVNGWSGFSPPGTVYLSRAMAAFPDPATVALLQGLEVQQVVVHLWEFPQDQQAPLKARLTRTAALTLADQEGEDYVYTLAANPWLRTLAGAGTTPGPVWFSGGVGDPHPEMEALAYYARYRLGWPGVYGDVPLGYAALPPLPPGVPADYMVQPPDEPAPTGYLALARTDFAATYRRDPALLERYDLARDGPLTGAQAVRFSRAEGEMRLTFGAYTTTTLTLRGPAPEQSLVVSPGVSAYVAPLAQPTLTLDPAQETPPNGARLLAAERWAGTAGASALTVQTNTLLLDTATDPAIADAGTVTTHLRIVPRYPVPGQFTLTLDIYQKPWGTHPDGHYGTFSIPVPVGVTGLTYDLTLHALEKTVTAALNSQPQEVFAWQGPPHEGDFAASLVLSFGNRLVEKVPVYDFTLRDGRLTEVQQQPARTVLAPLAAP